MRRGGKPNLRKPAVGTNTAPVPPERALSLGFSARLGSQKSPGANRRFLTACFHETKPVRGACCSPACPFPLRTRPRAAAGMPPPPPPAASPGGRGRRGGPGRAGPAGRAQVRRAVPGRAEPPPPPPPATLRSPRRGRPAAMGHRGALPARPPCRTGQCLRGRGGGATGGGGGCAALRAACGGWGRGAGGRARRGCAVRARGRAPVPVP